MRISKEDLIDNLIGIVLKDDVRSMQITMAYCKKLILWEKNQWIFVKDIEMSLKGIYRDNPVIFDKIKDLLLATNTHLPEETSAWTLDRINDVKKNLDILYGAE